MTDKTPEELADERLTRVHAWIHDVHDMPGPIGELFREVIHAMHDFDSARMAGGTTDGEDVRLGGIIDAAVECWEWLREGVRP